MPARVAPGGSLPPDWHVARSAVVVRDMWDTTHCATAARRVEEMAPRMNEVLHALRAQGALVVHAPDACMDFYAGTPARLRAVRAPFAPAPYRIDWHSWEPDELAALPALPATLTDPGMCSCESPEPCNDTPCHGTRQTALIDVAGEDVVTDDGQEFFNVLEERGIGGEPFAFAEDDRDVSPLAHLPSAHLPSAHLPSAHLPSAHVPSAHLP